MATNNPTEPKTSKMVYRDIQELANKVMSVLNDNGITPEDYLKTASLVAVLSIQRKALQDDNMYMTRLYSRMNMESVLHLAILKAEGYFDELDPE